MVLHGIVALYNIRRGNGEHLLATFTAPEPARCNFTAGDKATEQSRFEDRPPRSQTP